MSAPTEAEITAGVAAYREAAELNSPVELPAVLVRAIERKERKIVTAVLTAAADARETRREENG
jgi:hypothetical protein